MSRFLCVIAAVALPLAATAGPVETFRSICFAHLSDPAAIEKAAKKAGFDMTPLGQGSAMGARAKTDETVQINAFTSHKFECAVTTSDVADPAALGAKFFTALGLNAKGSKARAKANGQTYTFMHDTKGGEAFVVFAD